MHRSILSISKRILGEASSVLRGRINVRNVHGDNPKEASLFQVSQPGLLESPQEETIALDGKKYTVRNLELKDLPQAIELKRIQGTQDVVSCWETLSAIDPGNIVLAETETGEIISLVGMLHHHDDFYFTGLYYVSEKYRSLGLGKQMAAITLNRMGNSNFGCNAVPSMDKLLMKICGLLVMEDRFKCVVNEISHQVDPLALSDHGLEIHSFKESHLPHILEYDFSLHGHERRSLLEMSCRERGSQTVVAFRDGACVGFGSVKPSCQKSARVGPLYADDPYTAEAILRSLLLTAPQHLEGFAMMTFSSNSFASDFVKKLGHPRVAEYTRLYRRERLEVDTNRVYALFDFNTTPY